MNFRFSPKRITVLVLIIIAAAFIFTFIAQKRADLPVRQSQEIRTNTADDQKAVDAIENSLK